MNFEDDPPSAMMHVNDITCCDAYVRFVGVNIGLVVNTVEARVSDGDGHLSSNEMSFGAIVFFPSLGRSLKNKYYIIGFSIFGTLFVMS